MKSWICKKTAGHEIHGQGIIYCEETGKSVAIVYDSEENGNLLASAPDLLEACERALDAIQFAADRDDPPSLAERTLAAAIRKAKEGE